LKKELDVEDLIFETNDESNGMAFYHAYLQVMSNEDGTLLVCVDSNHEALDQSVILSKDTVVELAKVLLDWAVRRED
jgi:hypothetical protein